MRRMKSIKIKAEDLNDEGFLLYCVIILLDNLAHESDRNTEDATRRIKNMRNLLISELNGE